MLAALVVALLAPVASAGEVMFTQQGRLLDDTGTPLNGAHRLDVSLHTDLDDGTEVWHGTFGSVDFDEGYYMVTLTGEGTLGTDLDEVMAGGADLFFELHVDQAPSGALVPRQPLSYVPAAAHAVRAGGAVIVDLDASGTSCSTPGGLAYDASREALYLCDGTEWFAAYTVERPPVTFTYTGSDQTWTVPDNIDEITVTAWGAGGGAGRVAAVVGGAGGYAQVTVPVTPGETLTIVVGQGGTRVTDGRNGGGKGGGLSGVFTGTPSQANALVVAGGGGGAGYYVSSGGGSHGGNGGGSNGTDGAASDSSYYDSRGRGATLTAGGAGGCYSGGYCGLSGSALQGGYGGNYPGNSPYPGTYGGGGGNGQGSSYNSGGGGGGYWGGGGGSNNAPLGGGGGSGYLISSGTLGTLLTSSTIGVPPQTGHELYLPGVAMGGVVDGTTSGGPGLVVIQP